MASPQVPATETVFEAQLTPLDNSREAVAANKR